MLNLNVDWFPWDKEITVQGVKDIVQAFLNVSIIGISLSDASAMAYPTRVYKISTERENVYPRVR